MKTMKKLGVLAILGAAGAATAAYADAPRYDFGDVSYQSINDPSGSGLSSDHAFGVDGTYEFMQNWLVDATYLHESADLNVFGVSGTASGNSYEAGIGYRFPLNDSIDLVPNLSYAHSSASASAGGGGNSNSGSGYDAAVTLRAMVMPAVELDASVDHSSPIFATNTVGIEALYNFAPQFAAGLGYASQTGNGQTTNSWTVALRYYFK